ncbi:MAG: zinc metalloprotease HtpX [Acidobacteria bacterium]|nr:zinc metalloprotease HtpX [Acidobacteriota bacterium]MBU4495781.1 zinc metalloprotease HtpX [Acidobacteriota bacterium]MCG2816155.1 zinc metalloprotease HtpX [Candidatus Aminicenantes bacterium]
MYEQISRNKRRSFLLILFFFLLIFGLVWVFGQLTELGEYAVIPAVLIAGVMTFISYYSSDKIALAVSRARPVEKKEYPHLFNVVEGLAVAAGIPQPRCYVIDDSAPNAFASGRNPKNSVIAVTTGLLDKLNRAELEGVVAHEMSHIKNYDILVQTLAVVMVGVIALLSDWIMRVFFWGGRGRRRSGGSRNRSGDAGAIFLVIGLALAILSPLIAQLLRLAVSRKREFLADASSVMLTRYPPGLISALRKLSADTEPLEVANKATAHMYIINPLKEHKGAMNKLFSTHPPIEDRIAALESL